MELSDLSVTIGNYTFANPIMNAAGHAKRQKQFDDLLRSESSGIVVGSILPVEEVRMGNSGNVYYPGAKFGQPFSLNSLGIPCQPMSYYRERLPKWVQQAEDAGKHLILNVAGFKPDDYLKLTELALECGVKIIEVNFGCPNLVDGGEQKPIFSYDIPAMHRILDQIDSTIFGTRIEIWAKFSWLEPNQLKRTANMVVQYSMVKAVVTTNTLANCMELDFKGEPVITPNNGLAGLSGPAMRPIGLGQVWQWRTALDMLNATSIGIVGVGGASIGEHVFQYKTNYADLVQVGTAWFDACERHPGHGEEIFSTMLREYTEVLEANKAEEARDEDQDQTL